MALPKPFMPTAFKGTRDPERVTEAQNTELAARLRAAPSPAPSKPVAALPARERVPVQPLPPPSMAARVQAPVQASVQAPAPARRAVAPVDPTEALRGELREAKWAAEAVREESAEAVRQAQAEVTAAERATEKVRQQLVQETARREAAEARHVVTPGRAPGRKHGGAVRVATHEKLTPKLIAFPPVLIERLEALSLAYGLDQTATVRMAVTTQYEHAVKAGTITL